MKKIRFTTKILIVGMLLAGLVVNNAYAGKPTPPQPSIVKVTGSPGSWELSVNGVPFFIKGVCFGPSVARRTIDSYIVEVKELGANTLRTWGAGGDTKVLLDAAQKQGIKVCVGFWLQHDVDYVNDSAYKSQALADILLWLEKYKNHPAVLMWSVGNEVELHLQNYFHEPQLEAIRIAYAQFVEEICQKIKSKDPNHPVTSVVARGDWNYFKEYTPSLDLYATNAYGVITQIQSQWETLDLKKPYIITEFGPDGEWEVPYDTNGVPIEASDIVKADDYYSRWYSYIDANAGYDLGGFLFIYGEKVDFGGVWYNLLMDGLRRPSFYSTKMMYTGQPASGNKPPVVSSMALTPSVGISPNSVISLDVVASDPDGDSLKYEVKLCNKYVNGDVTLYPANFATVSEGVFNVTAPSTKGVYKIYIFVTDGNNNIGVETKSMKVE